MNKIIQTTIDYVKRGQIPFVSGVYIVFNNEHDILYVGCTGDFKRRLIEHFQGGSKIGENLKQNLPFSLDWPVSLIQGGDLKMEEELIRKHKPPFNDTYTVDYQYIIPVYPLARDESQVAANQFTVDILSGRIRQSTIELYRRDFKAYAEYAESWPLVCTPETLAKWRTALALENNSPNTINRKLSSIRSVMTAAAEQGLISFEDAQRFEHVRGVKVSAMRDKLKTDSRTAITAADMRRLCDAPDTTTLAGLMHRALLLTLAGSGIRISEAITLTPRQIEYRQKDGRYGYILHVTGKTDTGARQAPLAAEAYQAIQKWLAARPIESPWIFTGFLGRGSRDPQVGHIHPVSAWQIVKRYATACKLESIKPHDFRRFVGTTLAATSPRNAQKALGHKSIDTTYKHYVLDEMEVGLTDNLLPPSAK